MSAAAGTPNAAAARPSVMATNVRLDMRLRIGFDCAVIVLIDTFIEITLLVDNVVGPARRSLVPPIRARAAPVCQNFMTAASKPRLPSSDLIRCISS